MTATAATVALALVLTTGCSGAAGSKGSSASGRKATVLVGIRYSGGPVSRRPRPLAPGRVSVQFRDGRPLTAAKVGAGRRARFHLAPGHYRLAATSGDAHCLPRKLTVRREATVRADVLCSVK